jgi:hypothetical protein
MCLTAGEVGGRRYVGITNLQMKWRQEGEGDAGKLILRVLQTSSCLLKADNSVSLGGTSELGQGDPVECADANGPKI